MKDGVSMDSNVYRSMLDAMPQPILLVDQDLRVLDFNPAARDLMAVPSDLACGQRGGHVLYCLNAISRHEGCGQTPYCAKCGLRNCLQAAVRGERAVHSRTTLRLVRHGVEEDRVFRVTVAPIVLGQDAQWLIVLDDRTEQATLEKLFPLCASCRQSRTDADLLDQAADYLRRHWDIDPSTCLCANCRERLQTQPAGSPAIA
jgi:PAS domain-containing protein